MRLLQLKADNFRLFRELSLQAHCRLNFIFGANAAGKSSLLELIYVLGRGKSFRGDALGELAGRAGAQWMVVGQVCGDQGTLAQTQGLRWGANGKGLEARRAGSPATSVDLIRGMPVQILEPGMHRLVQEGPTYRRAFLDWGAFHVEPSFLDIWRRYRRALRQRNRALRSGAEEREIAAWEPELAAAGEELHRVRAEHLESLGAITTERLGSLLDEGEWTFDLQPGWPRGGSLGLALAGHRNSDRRAGTTQYGPHRDEVRIRAGHHGAKHRISRGQQKLVLAALLLAQGEQIGQRIGEHPVLLVDDFEAELARGYQTALLAALQAYPGQVFVTAFERGNVLAGFADASMFHVERGALRQLV